LPGLCWERVLGLILFLALYLVCYSCTDVCRKYYVKNQGGVVPQGISAHLVVRHQMLVFDCRCCTTKNLF
jgi:hypothetical protein